MTTLALAGPWGTSPCRAGLRTDPWRLTVGRGVVRSLALAAAALAIGAATLVPGARLALPSAGPAPAWTEASAGADAWPAGLAEVARSAIEADAYAVTAPAIGTGVRETTNPAHGLTTDFSRAGISVEPVEGDWTFGLALSAYGYAGTLAPPAAPDIVANANRVEYRRGPLTEWYLNDASGVEQGFTLAVPPAGAATTGDALVVELDLTGDLAATLDADGDGLTLTGADARLRYDGLVAYDATGRDLPARMALDGRTLRLEVDDRDAAYPLTIDPLISEPQVKLTAPDGLANRSFGSSVAIDGDTAVVGDGAYTAPAGIYTGAAYVFLRTGDRWSLQARLTASDGVANDYFGATVDVSGETVVVGAAGDDTSAGTDAGSAYVFVRDGAAWSEQAKLTADDSDAFDGFGSVAVEGDTVLVGAPFVDTADGFDIGSAYVFLRDGGVWSQQAKLTASAGGTGDGYGSPVALSGNTAVLGAGRHDIGANFDAGSAAVFVDDGGTWSEQSILTASDGLSADYFGGSVAIDSDTVVVGAHGDDTTEVINTGSAYVFVRDGATWSEQAKLSAFGGAEVKEFGQSVAVQGETVVVGTIHAPPAGLLSGSAHVFERGGTTWTGQFQVIAPDGAATDFFGGYVALSGDTALIGAYGDDSPQGDDTGSAYIVDLSNPPTFIPMLTIDDVAVLEGSTGKRTARFTLTLSDPSPVAVTVRAATASSFSARKSIDYVPRTAQLSIAPGQTAVRFDVTVQGDTAVEADETFYVDLNRPNGAVIARARGTGTILNDD